MSELTAIAPEFRDKLAKVLGMMGSAHDGEVVAAARRADAMIRNASLTWQGVICSTQVIFSDESDNVSDREMIGVCVDVDKNTAIFNDRESRFLRSIASQIRRHRSLSEKQRSWLRALYEMAAAERKAA
jgi:hypothetical protein